MWESRLSSYRSKAKYDIQHSIFDTLLHRYRTACCRCNEYHRIISCDCLWMGSANFYTGFISRFSNPILGGKPNRKIGINHVLIYTPGFSKVPKLAHRPSIYSASCLSVVSTVVTKLHFKLINLIHGNHHCQYCFCDPHTMQSINQH